MAELEAVQSVLPLILRIQADTLAMKLTAIGHVREGEFAYVVAKLHMKVLDAEIEKLIVITVRQHEQGYLVTIPEEIEQQTRLLFSQAGFKPRPPVKALGDPEDGP